MIKTIMFAGIAASVLALNVQTASAQATPVYSSPAQARTSNDALSTPRLNRVIRERRGFEPFAAAPRAYGYQVNQPTTYDWHVRDVSAY
jgi:hypothetical protein